MTLPGDFSGETLKAAPLRCTSKRERLAGHRTGAMVRQMGPFEALRYCLTPEAAT